MANEGSYEAASKRSDEIAADLEVHPEKYTMLTATAPRAACIWATISAR